jgi:hypothetical protein
MSGTAATGRVIKDGNHTVEVLNVLKDEIKKPESLASIREKALQIIQRAVDPNAGIPKHPSDGLLYGLIQSGKTSIINVAIALAVDNGFRCVIVLTTDIDPLYDQTLDRVRHALRGLNILGKNDWKDIERFGRQVKTAPSVVVCSKNGSKLASLLEAFKKAKIKALPTLIVDDEADQASLNTFTSKGNDQISRVNKAITKIRAHFPTNTYLQVTATPQSLFLQEPDHPYRPSFTVLSEPGEGYVGGDAFFGAASTRLLRQVNLDEVVELQASKRNLPPVALYQPDCKRLFIPFSLQRLRK